jgi:hypothetical protein
MVEPYRPLSDLTSEELHQRASEYRRMAQTARGEAIVSSLNTLAIRFAVLAAKREIEEEVMRCPSRPEGIS